MSKKASDNTSKEASSQAGSGFSIRTILLLFFVLQVTTAAISIGFISLRNGHISVESIVSNLLQETSTRVIQDVRSIVQEATTAVQNNANVVANGLLSIDDSKAWTAYLWGQRDLYPSLSQVRIGNQVGDWFGISWTQNEPLFLQTEKPSKLHIQTMTALGIPDSIIHTESGYHPLAQTWYVKPLTEQKTVWSPIGLAPGGKELDITLSAPVFDPNGYFSGVAAVSLNLQKIAAFLRKISATISGTIAILEPNGMLIASSEQNTDYRIENNVPIREFLANSNNPYLAQYGVLLEKNRDENGQVAFSTQYSYELGSQKYFVQMAPFKDPFGLNWIVAVSMPESEYLDFFFQNIRDSVGIGLWILIASILFGAIIAALLSRPIRRQSAQVARIQDFELHNDFAVSAPIKEVRQLSVALQQMQAGLQSFIKYVPRHLVRKILLAGEVAKLDGEVRHVTILFSDLRGYSTMIEQLNPSDIVEILNEYFGQMQQIIAQFDGVVLEHFGDAILAVFGAPAPLSDHAQKAVLCAQKMQQELQILNNKWDASGTSKMWRSSGITTIGQRIGIHSGNVVAGNMGGDLYMKYGVVGDVVNVAARLEAYNKETGTSILFSSDTYDLLDENLQTCTVFQGDVQLKGRETTQKVYSL